MNLYAEGLEVPGATIAIEDDGVILEIFLPQSYAR